MSQPWGKSKLHICFFATVVLSGIPKGRSVSIMRIQLLKSKIHRAQITGGNLNYEGSMTIDRALMDKAGLLEYEKILASNLANGGRFETYVIPGEPGSGAFILNGAASFLGKPGDRLTIMSFAWLDEEEAKLWHPRILVLGDHNKIINERGL
jgi:aspartate 1-decarboxylase